jgi:predicted Fe-Mo cluster-binding NifX family protein
VLSHAGVAIATAIASAGAALALSIWEKRVSRETGSQSLAVTADDTRLDALTSLGVFAALVAAQFKVAGVEGAATILISGLVLYVGIKNARASMLSLMDASVDPDLERDIIRVLSEMPEVHHVEKVRARRSGPFYFVEGHIHVARSMDVMRSHALTHEAQRAIREKNPQVEGVILHVEPHREKTRRVLVPITSQEGMAASLERHFGRAAWFLIATFDGNRLVDHRVERNPFQEKKVRAGLAVINWLVDEMKISAAILREVGEIAYHTLRDHYVEVFRAPDGTATDVLDAYAAGQLKLLPEPTHSSERKIETEKKPG